MKRFLLLIAMPFIVAGMVSFAVIVEPQHLDIVVSGMPSIDKEWFNTFKDWSIYIIVASSLSACLWYALAQWRFRLNDWSKSGKRYVWMLLIVLPLIVAVVAILKTPIAQEGMWWTYFYYFINALIPYYLATAFFSPSSFKFAPLGAQSIRRSW